jgi:hypothetical protein
MKWLIEEGLVKEGMKVLDYGCGKGYDADHLGFDGHDPYHRNRPELVGAGNYPTVVSVYVLNVIDSVKERIQAEKNIISSLAPGGTAYVAVRNDTSNLNGWTSKGTWQGDVEPHGKNWELIKKNPHFRMYRYRKQDTH